MARWLWLLLGLAVLASIGVGAYVLTRGLRNHNPGNIRTSSDRWAGLDNPPDDGEFFRFTHPQYGIRAIARILKTYHDRHGIHTIRNLVARWAPSNENPTEALIENMARRTGLDANEEIEFSEHLTVLVKAIIVQENGFQPYSNATIEEGISLA